MLDNFNDYKGACLHYQKILNEASTKRLLNDDEIEFLTSMEFMLVSFKDLYLKFIV